MAGFIYRPLPTKTMEIETGISELISSEEIKKRISELAEDISKDYLSKGSIYSVTVLQGARMFSEALRKELQALGIDSKNYDITLSSYSGTESTRNIKVVESIAGEIKGKDILVLEDIVDSGITIDFLVSHLLGKGAKSVKVCALTSKHGRREIDVRVNYIGFEIPNMFIVGFGMDFDGKYRDLPYIGHIENPEGPEGKPE